MKKKLLNKKFRDSSHELLQRADNICRRIFMYKSANCFHKRKWQIIYVHLNCVYISWKYFHENHIQSKNILFEYYYCLLEQGFISDNIFYFNKHNNNASHLLLYDIILFYIFNIIKFISNNMFH